jgi:hypothetical protein
MQARFIRTAVTAATLILSGALMTCPAYAAEDASSNTFSVTSAKTDGVQDAYDCVTYLRSRYPKVDVISKTACKYGEEGNDKKCHDTLRGHATAAEINTACALAAARR